VEAQYDVKLDVLSLAQISPAKGREVAVLGSNHPSYIWYASDPDNYDGNMKKADAIGLSVMQQDITAACWQARMGASPTRDPQATLKSCRTDWTNDRKQVCVRFYEKIRDESPEKAEATCVSSN
jgi:hypothetical protein